MPRGSCGVTYGQKTTDVTILNGMHHAADAGYLSGNRQGCLRGTREDVLWQIDRWLMDEHDQRVFWLDGLAGTGKSTIAQTFAETSFASGKLGASFFCSRDFEDRDDIRAIFPTLAFQLAYRYPEFRKELLPTVRASPDIGRESLCSQLDKVIVNPLKATGISTLIIIDALDECKDEGSPSIILSVLSRCIDQIPRVKFFITGRPEPRIRSGFRLELLWPITEVLRLHDVESRSVADDIKLFFRNQLGDIAKHRSNHDVKENWPSSYEVDILCRKAAGLFIYASTVVEFIASPHHLLAERLALIISLPDSTSHEGKSGIDILYTNVLEQAFHDAGPDEQELYSRFKLVVGAVLLVFHPISRKTLSELVKSCGTPLHISSVLRSLHSLLLVPESEADPIRIFHKSFPDFLTDRGRCKDDRFFVDPPAHHIDILFSCFRLMKEKLRKNICGLDGCPTLSEVKDLPTRRETCIGGALEYACRFWTKHLAKIPGNGPHAEQVQEAIDEFFTKRLLFWIEVLSLAGNLNVGVYALDDIEQWYLSVSFMGYLQKPMFMCVQARVSCKWTYESRCFILLNFDAIRASPITIYRDALPFSPSSSWLHEWYTAKSLQTVKVASGGPYEWGACSRVVSFDHFPEVLACHKDTVAVGLSSGDIIALDAITGTRKSAFSGHTDGITSLVFSLDGALLVSGSKDKTVKLWDIQTGGVLKEFDCDTHRPCSVSISPDAIMIASGSHNNAICLWDVRTGKPHRVIERCFTGQEGRAVICVKFVQETSSPLMAASEAGLVQQFDIGGSGIGNLVHGDRVAFSSDGRRFVSVEEGPLTVKSSVFKISASSPDRLRTVSKIHTHHVVRYSRSGTIVTSLSPATLDWDRCCFSTSGEFVVGVDKGRAYVWNIESADLVESFPLHTKQISSLVFPSSLISASSDKSVRFWQVGGSSPNQVATKKWSTGAASIGVISIYLQVEERTAITINSGGVVGLWDLSTGLRNVFFQPFEASGDNASDARVVEGVLTIVFYGPDSRWKITTWDVEKEAKLRTVVLPPGIHVYGRELRISGDGTRVFGLDTGCIRTWSTSKGTNTGDIPFERQSHSYSPSFILDGSRLWVCSENSPAQGWDLRNPSSPPLPLTDMPSDERRLDFIQVDNTNGLDAGPTRIEDTITKKEVFRLPERFAQPSLTQWDGRYLVAAYNETGKLLILDFAHMIPR